jgi:hypothetical protein
MGLLASGLWRPDTMQADREPSATATGPVLNQVAALARFEDTQPESGKVIIPQKIISFTRFGGIHDTLRKPIHFVTNPKNADSTEAPRKQ